MNLFSILTKIFVVLMPFYVIIKVFFEYKLWVSYFWLFIKELVIISLFFSLVYEFIKSKKIPKFDILDYLIFWYFIYWILITFINWLWFDSIFYGWRYDFMFLFVLLIFRHWAEFLKIKFNDLFKAFIISGSIALFLWLFVKFIIWEEVLVLFGYNYYVANWAFSGSIPIYHWVEASGIRRFQWLLDWPNQMAFFLLLFWWVVLHITKKKFDFHMLLIYLILFSFILLTYSRSALLALVFSISLVILLNIKTIFRYYKKIFILWILWFFSILWVFWFVFKEKIENIFLRKASTWAHYERMEIWLDRFIEHPFGQGLASSGPAYRSIYTDKNLKEDEKYFIPESWFIQQLVEGWIVYFLLFISILWIILFKLYFISVSMFWVLSGVLVMSFFLHILEATYLSSLLFLFIWLLLSRES